MSERDLRGDKVAGRHGSHCGRRIALEIQARNGTKQEVVGAIHRHCNVSLLRAHRIAYGYTLAQVTELLKEILSKRGIPCEGLAHQTVSRWENAVDIPSMHYFDALCYLYRTRPDRLGFGHDYSSTGDNDNNREAPDGASGYSDEEPEVRRREFLNAVAIGTLATSVSADSSDNALERHATVGAIEERIERSGYQLYTAPPTEFVPARMIDLADIQRLLLQGQPLHTQRRLYRAAAKAAGFIAIRFIDVGTAQETFHWFDVARNAARQAQDAGIEAWVSGHLSDAYVCFGHSPQRGLDLARAAQQAGEQHPAALFGYLCEAGVQSRLGRRRETLEAVRRAEKVFEALPPTLIAADGLRVPEYFLRWHQSNALSVIGEGRLAEPFRKRALELPLGQDDLVGHALLQLDQASLLFRAGEVDHGCALVKHAWEGLPSEFHVGQVPSRTATLLNALTPTHAAAAEVRSLREYLQTTVRASRQPARAEVDPRSR